MGTMIGMDEAGYGPNLGPLVVTATVWTVPGPPRETDLRELLSAAVTDRSLSGDARVAIADSKQLYSPARGLHDLERGVLAALALNGPHPIGFRELVQRLTKTDARQLDVEPWFLDADLNLPHTTLRDPPARTADRLKTAMDKVAVSLDTIQSDVVTTRRFNQAIRDTGSKGVALSRISMNLLRDLVDFDSTEPVLIICDKHGGRNRYDDLLAEIADERMVFRIEEGRERSVYRIGKTEIVFRTKAEAAVPAALASMVCKYVRELAMDLFNQFWQNHSASVRPTKGYPQDAKRFREETEQIRSELGIDDDNFWRVR